MQNIEEQALSTYTKTLPLWVPYVEYTFTAVHKDEIDTFRKHLNRHNPHIQFTKEINLLSISIAGILGAKRNPGGQNLGGIPVVIPPRSHRVSRRGAKTQRPKSRRPKSRRASPPALSARSEIPAAKISAGSRW